MEVLDTTIANVALRYIAGGLSASNVDSEWVLTSYLAANATILPITGWLSAHLGRRNYFLLSIAVFTIASGLCGMATSLEQLILFRVIQGLGGGGLQPSSQAILLDSFPPEKQGAAQTMFGIAALLAPVVGPTLGGYLTVTYDWRWIFYINVPVGALGFLASYFLVDDPDYLKKERAELRRRPLNFDYIGLGLLVLIMSSWEVMLSKGQEWDWYNDPFWRVQTLFVVFVLGLGLPDLPGDCGSPTRWSTSGRWRERNFAASCIIIFCAYGILYGASTSLPGLLQSLFGYDAYVSGLVQSPSGVFSIMGLIVVGTLIGRGVDARWLITAGPADHGGRELLDGADEPVHQPDAGDLAAGGVDRRTVDDLRVDQRGRLQVHPAPSARGRGRPVRLAPQRGGQRRHVHGPGPRVATRTFPHGARGRVSRPPQPGGELVPSSRPEPSSSSRRVTRPRRSRWPCRRWRTSASSRRLHWPTSTTSGCSPSSRWPWSFWFSLMKRSVAEKGEHIGAE